MGGRKLASVTLILAFLAAGIGVSLFAPIPSTFKWDTSLERNANIAANAINLFALKLFENVKGNNNVFSPLSIWIALAMAYEGAHGITAEEMRKALNFPENKTILRETIAYIMQNFAGGKDYNLTLANSLWPDERYTINESYVNLVQDYYDAYVQRVDYEKPEKAREIINSWVENCTHGRIKEMIPPNLLTPLIALVLSNAIYFNATWLEKFEMTWIDTFYTPEGEIEIPMMHKTAEFGYAEDDEVKVLEMPYKGERFSMLIVLPKDMKSQPRITLERLDAWRRDMRESLVKVTLPRFTVERHYNLKKPLMSMGMRSAFHCDADFSGIGPYLYMDFVLHDAYIKVTENGTEAAAATGVGMVLGITPYEYEFNANHPFIFLIQDKDTGAIIFMGEVINPSS